MTAAEQPAEALGDAVDDWADWLGDMDESANHFDITDEATTIIEITVEELARRIVSRLAAVPAAVDERAGGETVTEWGIDWDEKAPGLPDISGPFEDRAFAEVRLDGSVFDGRIVRRTVATTDCTPATPPTQERPGD